MKFQPQHPRPAAAFTLVELLCVMAIMGLLAALLLPALALGKDRAKRIVCVNNEREQGMAFHMFLHDHDSKFPMAVPISDGGSEEFAQNGLALGGQFYFSYHHFQVLSNYSALPQELACPADQRLPAANMARLSNKHLSYFVAINANYNDPGSILAGDRNVTAQSSDIGTIQTFEPRSRLHWTRELHQFMGDVLFADGHVELWNQLNLTADLRGRNGRAVFFLPSVSVPSQIWDNNPNRPGPAPQPVHETNPNGGNQNLSPGVTPSVPSGTSSAGAGSTTPNPPVTAETTHVVPLPGAGDVTGSALPTDGGIDGKGGCDGRPGGAGGDFRAFITSGWWFWLCLLLALGLAETWRRMLKDKQAKGDAKRAAFRGL
jgi:prepilin-type N-terminal cleavage/methylation domain-containing protein/prepilin-type processing-associated H-X9-DG protein